MVSAFILDTFGLLALSEGGAVSKHRMGLVVESTVSLFQYKMSLKG